MGKTLIAFGGLIILISGFILNSRIKEGEKLAAARNKKENKFAMISDEFPQCNWNVHSPESVMAENKSQAIMVDTKNPAKKQCETYLSLRAPGFDMNPTKEEQKVTLPAGGKGSISWIIIPDKVGTFDVTVSDIINTKIFGVTVTNTFGLTASQAKLFSTLSGLFGPMLTIPWWVERWRQRKPNPEAKKETPTEKQPE